MKKKVITTLLVLLIAGGAGAGGWYYYTNHVESSSTGEIVYVTEVKSLTASSSGIENRYAGVVEPQETVSVQIDSGRKVTEVEVEVGQVVKKGELLFKYDLSSIQEELQEAQLALERLKNEALSLEEQIKTLEREKRNASADNQLSYTIEIETNKMNLKKNEYDQQNKAREIEQLQSVSVNTEVRSQIDGVIQKVDSTKLYSEDGDSMDSAYDYMGSSSEENNAFITILSTGAYRIKGTVNEQNARSLIEGVPVIIRSRVDEKEIWRGTMGNIDRDNTISNNNNSMYYGSDDGSDSQTNSSRYPFYINLDSSEGLMLGQHVYIELDKGQEDEKLGIWIGDYFIQDIDTENPYVWVAGENEKLKKRTVVLGQYDESMMQYEIADGLTEEDCIAFPADWLEEGMKTVKGTRDQLIESTPGDYSDEEYIYGDPEDYEVYDMQDGVYEDESEMFTEGESEDYYEEDYTDGEIIEDYEDVYVDDMDYDDSAVEMDDFTDEYAGPEMEELTEYSDEEVVLENYIAE